MSARSLTWTENLPPGEGCSYDHARATTSFGDYQIEWKSWKEHGGFVVYFNQDYLCHADDLQDAKVKAQKDFDTRVENCVVR